MRNVSLQTPGLWRHWFTNASGVVTSDTSTLSAKSYTIRTSSGYVGPFPSVRPLPVHAYNFNSQQISLYHSAGYNYTNGTHEYAEGPALSSSINGATFSPAYDWTALENQALTNLNNGTTDMSGKDHPGVRGDLDISIDLAEIHKTVKTFNAIEQVVDISKTFVKRFGPFKAASHAWLAYTYGIKPTLSTLWGAADENIRVVINKTSKYRARASGHYFPKTVTLNTVVGVVNFPLLNNESIKTSVTYGVDIRTDQFDLARWSSLNPASIAWELLPFSFVVDWFYAVGGYLRNMETYLLYANKFRSGYKTRFSVSDIHFGITDVGKNVGEISHSSIWRGTLKHVDIQRSILSSYPAPHLPVLGANLGSSRLLSAASLLATLLSSGGKPGKALSKSAQRAIQERARYYQSRSSTRTPSFPKTHYHL